DYMFKLTVWEEATRIPLFIHIPGLTAGSSTTDHPVSLIDLYPTLLDLCGLPDNPHGELALDGHSLSPFFEDPDRTDWEGPNVALSVVFSEDPLEVNTPGDVDKQHFTIRSKRYRYTLCGNGEEELYDHVNDSSEWHNLANLPQFRSIKASMKSQLLQMTGRIQ
ncbi:MAG: DUF4976 domain-containing protein, partial [Verrucomicrobia bacterium]|nr:DUF4976 domain-containing protein [Verrucomicrobiota bacterium]